MTRAEVIGMLSQNHSNLFHWLDEHPDERWTKGPAGKWNTGEHIVHLIQSAKALNRAFIIPKFYLKYKFGTNNRDNRTYDEVVKRYHEKLRRNPGIVAPASRSMPKLTESDKQKYINQLDQQREKLTRRFSKWKDEDLDTYLLPHPLIGRMTIREIVMWTAYHTEHHYNILKENY